MSMVGICWRRHRLRVGVRRFPIRGSRAELVTGVLDVTATVPVESTRAPESTFTTSKAASSSISISSSIRSLVVVQPVHRRFLGSMYLYSMMAGTV
ncbi:hypothetical protein C9J85_17065 [Haloferax sp. wsp5]|nr:hypothetical protein C9J85_17065 [Haloferax sp. wsp5]